jgi:hypothetical protein
VLWMAVKLKSASREERTLLYVHLQTCSEAQPCSCEVIQSVNLSGRESHIRLHLVPRLRAYAVVSALLCSKVMTLRPNSLSDCSPVVAIFGLTAA